MISTNSSSSKGGARSSKFRSFVRECLIFTIGMGFGISIKGWTCTPFTQSSSSTKTILTSKGIQQQGEDQSTSLRTLSVTESKTTATSTTNQQEQQKQQQQLDESSTTTTLSSAVSVSANNPVSRVVQDYVGRNDTGWTTIEVFVGQFSVGEKKWYAEVRQDEIVATLLNQQTNGYLIDLATNDALFLNNAYALEQHYNWTGLCIEPNPTYWYELTRYRSKNCQLVSAVVGDHRMEEVSFRFDQGGHGGIAGEGFANGVDTQNLGTKQYTVSLIEIFQRYNVPSIIDYFSLDVEGAETYILQNFPLDNYKFKIMTVERVKKPTRELLISKGYEYIGQISSWGETLWVHTDYKNDMNWDAFKALGVPLNTAFFE